MLQEIFLGEKLRWPEPYRCAVNLVFNYQGAEGLSPLQKGASMRKNTPAGSTDRGWAYGGFCGCWRNTISRRRS